VAGQARRWNCRLANAVDVGVTKATEMLFGTHGGVPIDFLHLGIWRSKISMHCSEVLSTIAGDPKTKFT
jgi:hypothetical protein